nr:immunoglobulin light chain junction region [Macaca mulatta]
CQRCNSLPYSF